MSRSWSTPLHTIVLVAACGGPGDALTNASTTAEASSSATAHDTTTTQATADTTTDDASSPASADSTHDTSTTSTAAEDSSSETSTTTCGDGVLDPSEQCDDGNDVAGDGCDDDCTRTEILDLQVAYFHVCALVEGGRVRCWGRNDGGQLGRGDAHVVGDDELPADGDDVMLPWPVAQLTSSFEHNCARNQAGDVVCWGGNGHGELGYGNTDVIGDDELPLALAPVDIGGASVHVAVSQSTTCSTDAAGGLRCWGLGTLGRLGYGNTQDIGDDELPSAVGTVPLGATVREMCSDAGAHTCAVLEDGDVKCWGFGNYGQLGNGNLADIGDDETPASQPSLSFDVAAAHVVCGLGHTCALFEDGSVRCWGHNNYGQLGRGDVLDLGDAAPATTVEPLAFDDPAVEITAGHRHTCIRHGDGTIRCWGYNGFGQLGRGNVENIGDDEPASTLDAVDTGGTIVRVEAGGNNTCVVYDDQRVRCWGANAYGQNGLGPRFPLDDGVGDDVGEVPSALPDVQILLTR